MKVSKATIIRTAVLVLALANQILVATGHPVIEISDDQLTELISACFTVVAAGVAWWKNNSFTKNAIEADKFLDNLRSK